jgi:hypothetical protein
MTRAFFAGAVLAILAAAVTSAHEVTYKGTVVAVEHNRYAASDGVLGAIEIKITPGGRTRTFDVTAYTRLWRGETPVNFADARIQAGETVVLTWVDEEAEKGAQEIRLRP